MKRLTIWYRTVKNSSALNYIYIKPFNGYEVRMMCFQSKHLIYRLYKVVHFQANMQQSATSNFLINQESRN